MLDEEPVPVRQLESEPPPASIVPIIRSTLLHVKRRHMVSLTSRELAWLPETKQRNCGKTRLVKVGDIVAVRPTCGGDWTLSRPDTTEFTVYSFRRKQKHLWRLVPYTFDCQSDRLCRQWLENLQRALAGMRHRPRVLKVFINPFGGKRRAVKIYEKDVKHLWELAGISLDETVTQDEDHAPSVIREMDLRKYDGVVCVGGDGLFSQVMNHLLIRTQLEAGVDLSRPRFIPARPRIKLGIIPAGSTNAICYSTTGNTDPATSAMRIAIGDTRGIDVFSAENSNKFLYFGMSASYGYLGDVLVESEKHRWMGPCRYDYAGAMKWLRFRSYTCDVSLVNSCDADNHPKDNTRCRTGCSVCEEDADGPSPAETPEKGAMARAGDSEVVSEPSQWHSVCGKFNGIVGVTTSAATARSPHGVSPCAHLGDGCIDVSIIRKCSRFSFLKLLLKIKNSGTHLDLPFIEVYRVQEFKLRCLETGIETERDVEETEESKLVGRGRRRSVWNLDGEIMNQSDIHIRVHRQLITLFSRGIEDET